ncbi:bifunctional chorismate-binding protein/class IV aminotransferase [Alysiella crassa]|uniref:Para-aminobenzoate synthase component 1 n=1 Tax=Alysiella crassa TaxID=153491 RepID=A0A376BMJ4_9NEIS|nr:bifunctional chorismate-binding protein/class IV aminotransferase [Alysiella crassa]UOP06939.1 chorismate-binding protein [Alysiella crassa]SSY70929.1 Para-aminobenzoate synthase component 1 [Alysiella crassa]
MQAFVLFDDIPQKRAVLLQHFVHSDTFTSDTLEQLDDCLQKGWAKQWHCALFADYELGLPLQKLVERTDFSGSLKIYWFAEKHILPNAETWLAERGGNAPAGIATPQISQAEADYHHTINQIHEAIRRGDTYQINHTVRLHTTTYGNPIRLYARLRQNVPYAVLAALPDGGWTLCFSPELFLRIENNGKITTEPMKGTAPILGDGLDEQRAAELRADPKNRAENTMIVDLLRNDLGKLAEIGGVSVPEPFKINAFGTVWQMTSVVQAQLKQGITFSQILRATFPCGSITGAPKRKSMEIINLLEDSPRALYTGSIGFLEHAPDSALGFSGCLNVVIRTLNLIPKENSTEYLGTYGVGSGIVIDSRAADEYAECAWKARFLSELRPECDLFETMRVEQGKIALLTQHIDRLAHSALCLNIPFTRQAAMNVLENVLVELDNSLIYRMKLSLTASGSLKTEYAPLAELPENQKIIFSDKVLANHDPLRRHKTSHRADCDHAWQAAERVGAFDGLLFNENGDLLEGGRSSVMILWENQWLTPPLDLDILPSIARQIALNSDSLKEARISREMVRRAEKIRVGNALRGWLEVTLLEI